nr:muramidase [Clostridium cellulovorans]
MDAEKISLEGAMQANNPNSLLGVDLNEFNKDVNLQVLARRFGFIYLRACSYGSGRLVVDKKFAEYAKECRDNGIPAGGYIYSMPSSDLTTADEQCDTFIEILQTGFGNNDYGDLFPVLDVEGPIENLIPTTDLIDWIERFKKRFERKTRRRLMLYVGEYFVGLYDNFYYPGRGFPLSVMPLWIAKYRLANVNDPIPSNVGGWTRWRVWQYSETGSVPGARYPVDLNYGPDNIDYLIQPDIVSGLTATRRGNNIYVRWNANKDLDLAGYNLFINRNYVTTLGKTSTSYNIPLRKYNYLKTPYIVAIEAFDRDGEVSKRRASVTIQRTRNEEFYEEVEVKEKYNVYIRYPEGFNPEELYFDEVDS